MDKRNTDTSCVDNRNTEPGCVDKRKILSITRKTIDHESKTEEDYRP